MVYGDSIIMPIDMVSVAVMRSMTRNGSMIRKPISNPRRNSEIMKAGIRVRSGVASGELPCFEFATLRRISRCPSAGHSPS